MNLQDQLAQAEQEYQSNRSQSNQNEWFTIKEGDNRIRIVTAGALYPDKYKLGIVYGKEHGYPYNDDDPAVPKTTIKWLYWIIDRQDENQLKLAKLPHTIVKSIVGLQTNPDYTFHDFPMPYDITINAKNAGKKEVIYTILPARQNTPLSEKEIEQINQLNKTEDIVQKMKDKKILEHQRMGIWKSPEQLEQEKLLEAKHKQKIGEDLDRIKKIREARAEESSYLNQPDPDDIPF